MNVYKIRQTSMALAAFLFFCPLFAHVPAGSAETKAVVLALYYHADW
jgi:hypothetical protein